MKKKDEIQIGDLVKLRPQWKHTVMLEIPDGFDPLCEERYERAKRSFKYHVYDLPVLYLGLYKYKFKFSLSKIKCYKHYHLFLQRDTRIWCATEPAVLCEKHEMWHFVINLNEVFCVVGK